MAGPIFAGILGLILLSSCAGLRKPRFDFFEPHQPPPHSWTSELLEMNFDELAAIKVTSPKEAAWRNYRLGLLAADSETACELFKNVADNGLPPLQPIAELRAWQHCHPERFPRDLSLPTSYSELLPLEAEVRLHRALKSADTQDDIPALWLFADVEKHYRRREELLRRALAMAEDLGDPRLIDEAKDRLHRNSPRLDPQSAWGPAVRNHRLWAEYDLALRRLRAALKTSQQRLEKYEIQNENRLTLRAAQRKTEALKPTQELWRLAQEHHAENPNLPSALKLLHDSGLQLARALWTEDRVSSAVEVLNKLENLLGERYPLDEVRFTLARIHEEKGELPKARRMYQEILTLWPQTQLADRLRWLMAWIDYKLGDYDLAISGFERIERETKSEVESFRALYWKARSLKKLKQDLKAQELLQELARKDQLGYYGALAELESKAPPQSPSTQQDPPPLWTISGVEKQQALRIEWLISLGEKPSAIKALEEIPQPSSSTEQITLRLAHARARNYSPLFSYLSNLTADERNQLLRSYAHLLFPTHYLRLIQKASEETGIPTEYILSIIRQESAFDEKARSPADAYGLMQLLFPVAQKLAENTGMTLTSPEDLYKPEINIRLGAKELQNLRNRWANLTLVTASYNAAESAVRGWLKTRKRNDILEFIEEIPYEETRTYVKLVFRNNLKAPAHLRSSDFNKLARDWGIE
ncbi:MAG: transglycosylase SLT domain-containing protein [Bdellovibrionaceae bacterium]|nr:transglycosylase SLT domain-containing protein [Pseudobdellovibrionaceae bacterium]